MKCVLDTDSSMHPHIDCSSIIGSESLGLSPSVKFRCQQQERWFLINDGRTWKLWTLLRGRIPCPTLILLWCQVSRLTTVRYTYHVFTSVEMVISSSGWFPQCPKQRPRCWYARSIISSELVIEPDSRSQYRWLWLQYYGPYHREQVSHLKGPI